MNQATEIRKKMDELSALFTGLPDNAKMKGFSNSHHTYDLREGGKSDGKVIGKQYSFSMTCNFEEIFQPKEKLRD